MAACLLVTLALPVQSLAEENTASPSDETTTNDQSSSWLITPLISSDPKISTAGGIMVGYVHQFDELSPPSLISTMGTYSTTKSWYAGAFAKTHFGEDNHRVTSAYFRGQIRNDYDDFLGSGQSTQTTDNLNVFALRYAYQFWENWYLGPQFLSTNYVISGEDALSGQVLDTLGLTGFTSNGAGLYAQYDTLDNKYSPTTGDMFQAYNVAYREDFGGDVSFDTFVANYQHYIPLDEDVLGWRISGRWTKDAPPGGYSSIDIRGYTRGQYLAQYMTAFEADYRHALNNKWGLTAYAGLGVLYGSDSMDDTDRFYPGGSVGTYYKLNDAGMVIRADFAMGKDGNHGFYLQFGQAFSK